MKPPVFIGTAGWSIPSRYKPDFPESGSHLDRYAARFDAVEINSSFYHPHRRTTYERWAASVGAGFRFSAKLPKTITHEQRLRDCRPLMEAFADQVTGLGDRLGTILIQLPPSLAFDIETTAAFFDDLQSIFDVPLACEPRHASWFTEAAEHALIARQIARVAADPAPVAGGGFPGGWAGFRYIRLHGSPIIYRSSYGEARLRAYAALLTATPPGAACWCILDNTADMAAVADALLLQELMSGKRDASGTPALSER